MTLKKVWKLSKLKAKKLENTKESLEDKIQKLSLVNSKVENPVKTEEKTTIETKESVTGNLDFMNKYFPGK